MFAGQEYTTVLPFVIVIAVEPVMLFVGD